MQKYLKNNKGFTLVEVIVVAVIVLILAAVAIPLYNGYIQDSRQATAENIAGTVAGLAGAAQQVDGALSVSGQKIQLAGGTFGNGAEVTIPTQFGVAVTGTGVVVTACGNATLKGGKTYTLTGTFTKTTTGVACAGSTP